MRVLKWLHDTVLGADDGTYADMQTMFGRTRVYDTEDAAGEVIRVLDVEGTWQSGSYVGERWADLAFAYHRRFDEVIFGRGAVCGRMLMLGGGALSYPKHVVALRRDVLVDVVEIDPAITDLARRYFFLDRLDAAQRSRLHVAHDDAARFLDAQARAGTTYDAIANDAFAAADAPGSLTGDATAARLRDLLAPGGMYAANVVSAIAGRDATALRHVTRSLASAFAHVWVIPLGADEPRVPDNNVVVATDGRYAFSGALSPAELFG